MNKYEVVTRIERVPVIQVKDASLKVRFATSLIKKQQKDVWRLVNKYFAEANDKGSWEFFKKGIDDETEVEITYNAKDKTDAEREIDVIKNKAFSHLGQASLQRIKRKFGVSKQFTDDNPTFEKLRNSLAVYQIFLSVDIVQK